MADESPPPQTAREYAALWRSWAKHNRSQADQQQKAGDSFGASLCRARADVRTEAAELVTLCSSLTEAAKIMHDRAAASAVRELPIIGFDEQATEYTRARSWQYLALQLDPTLPLVQPLLD